MPRSFFRDNLKDGRGKKNGAAASADELRDSLLREEMEKAAKTSKAKEALTQAPDASGEAEDAAEKIASLITGPRQCSPVGIGAGSCHADGDSPSRSDAGINSLTKTKVYDDVQVCRVLGLRRRILAKARTNTTRGTDWDCVGLHAGMSQDWIVKKLNEFGKPVTEILKMNPVQDNDGVISVKLLGVWQNTQKVTVEVVATGAKELATVKDSREMRLGDIFDCRRFGTSLCWVNNLNCCAY